MLIIAIYYDKKQGALVQVCLLVHDFCILSNIVMKSNFLVRCKNTNEMNFVLFLLANMIRRSAYFRPYIHHTHASLQILNIRFYYLCKPEWVVLIAIHKGLMSKKASLFYLFWFFSKKGRKIEENLFTAQIYYWGSTT